MPDKYSISVVIPNYNRAEKLVQAVNSALAQTFPVLEILVCDDGSDDESEQRIASIKDQKVKWISCGRNGRPAIPRNIGIRQSAGNYIAFLDNDDEWLPEKLERQVEVLKTMSMNAVCSNAVRIAAASEKGNYLQKGQNTTFNFYSLVVTNEIICSSLLIKKELLQRFGLFPEQKEMKALEDYALWLRISTAEDFYYIGKPLLRYLDESAASIRSGSLSTEKQLSLIFGNFKKMVQNCSS